MNKSIIIMLLCFVGFFSGCRSNLILERIKEHGVNRRNTKKLKFTSSEGAYGGNFFVVIEDPKVISYVWDSLESAKPTKLWYASGFHKIEFYADRKDQESAVTVRLNMSNAAHVEGDMWYHSDSKKEGYYGLWECKGLAELVMKYLKQEYERKQRQ